MASGLFTDPGIASAASVLSRAIAADDPYKDLSNLGSAYANTELGISRRQQTQGDADASALILRDPNFWQTNAGRAALLSAAWRGDPAKLKLVGESNLALAAPELGVESPLAAAFSQGAGVDTRGTGYGATKHETAETGRNATTAGAHVAAALGSARIAAAQREAESLRQPLRPGSIIPPAERHRWGVPDVVTPGVPVLEGSTESVTPSVTGPQGPFAFPTDSNLPAASTRYDYSGNLLNPDGTLKTPVERQGPPGSIAQVIAQEVLKRDSVGRVIEGTATEGEKAIVTPAVTSATIRAQGNIDAVKARAAALAAKGPNGIIGYRVKLVADQLEAAQRDPNLSEEQKQQLAAAADQKLAEIDREHGGASGTVQAAQISTEGRRAIAELASQTRLKITDQNTANRLQIAEANIAQRAATTETQDRIAQAKMDWLREREGLTTQAALDLADRKHAAKMEEIALQNTKPSPNANRPLDANQAKLINNEVGRLVLSDLGESVPTDPQMFPSRIAGKLSADQRKVANDLTVHASNLLSSGQVKSAAEAVAKAREDLGYSAVTIPGTIYNSKDIKLGKPPAAAQASTTAPTTTGAPVKRMRNPSTGQTVIWNGTAWVPE